VGIARSFFFDDVDVGVEEVIETFLGWLASEGTVTGRVADFGAAEAQEHWTRIVQCEGAALHHDWLTSHPEDFSPDVRGRLAQGLDVPATDLVRSLRFRTDYRRRLSLLFDELELIVSPVVPVDVPKVEGQNSRAQTAELGRITYPWALHEGPTLSLPIGFHPRSGNPVGVSLSARRFDEATLFQVAAAYQDATDWHTRRPVLPPS
jgi:aspartyl-tRNA(Asn)/glutamyl-tRNA(Gln) amidotransferase subunit A